MIDKNAIPDRLKSDRHWVCWRTETRGEGKPTKVPITPGNGNYADVSDPDTWNTFTAAYRHYTEADDVDGIGFVFTSEDPYVGVDLDDCRSPQTGALMQWAKDVITRLDSYTEVSPSGTGVHILNRGERPEGKQKSGDIELYDRDRYFTVTGDHLDMTPNAVYERSEALAAIHEQYLADDESETSDFEAPPRHTDAVELSDNELLDKARNASNGDRFEQLWNGDTSGYKSHSEADQALCNMLAFWTGGDPHQMERLFNRSGLTRDKWSERSDYRERTIQTAIQDCPAHYDPDGGSETSD